MTLEPTNSAKTPAGDAQEWLLGAMHIDVKLFAQINKVGLHQR
jgi:hypothetical protein